VRRQLKLIFTGFLVLGLGLVSCNKEGGQGAAGGPELKTDDDKTVYTIGTMFGEKLKTLNLSEREVELMVKGLRHAAMGAKPEADPQKFQMQVQQLFRTRMNAATDVNKKKGMEYLTKYLADGGKKTASGIGYKILKEGSGDFPGPKDTVEVHYHGTLTDGTVFDSSKTRGKTISFPLNRVIKGWTEGLQLVRPGGQIQLVIPSDLAYGDHGAPPKIPGGSTLVFDVELFKVTKFTEKKEMAPKKPTASAKKVKKQKK